MSHKHEETARQLRERAGVYTDRNVAMLLAHVERETIARALQCCSYDDGVGSRWEPDGEQCYRRIFALLEDHPAIAAGCDTCDPSFGCFTGAEPCHKGRFVVRRHVEACYCDSACEWTVVDLSHNAASIRHFRRQETAVAAAGHLNALDRLERGL